MSKLITVNVNKKPAYDIMLEKDFSMLKGKLVELEYTGKRCCIVCDSNTKNLYLAKLKKAIDHAGYIRCATLLVKSDRTEEHDYGNHADDAVEEYPYNFVYYNDGPLNELDHDFMWFFYTCMVPSWQESH